MYDPFEIQVPKKLDFKTLDFRNGIYQGEVSSSPLVREGFGMALDHNFLLTLGNWRNNILAGESIIIFPDQTHFYGNIVSSLPQKFCCYHPKPNLNIYSMFNTNSVNSFVLDNLENKTLQQINLSANMMKQLIHQTKANELFLVQEHKRPRQPQEIAVSAEQSYENNNQKWQLLESMLNVKINEEERSFQSYLKTNTIKNVEIKAAKLQVTENQQYFQFSFKNSCIKCKFISHSSSNVLKIKHLGFYLLQSNNFTISKSYNYDTQMVQQNMNGKSFSYPITPLKRPLQCLVHFHKYCKQSLNFVNQYLGIDYLYRIKFIFSALERLFQVVKNKNSSVNLFQIGKTQRDNLNDSMNQSKRYSLADFIKKSDLQAIKHQMHRMARKHTSSLKNKSFFYSPPKNKSLTGLQNSRSQSAQLAHCKRIGTISNSKYLKTQQPVKKITNRSQFYLQQQSRKSKYDSKVIDSGSKQQQTQTKTKKRHFQGFLSKYAYLEEQSKQINKKKIENIKTLTQRYQQIERQLKKGSIPSSNLKAKSKKYSNSKEVSQYNLAKTFNKQKNESTFNGSKKILKYGWE